MRLIADLEADGFLEEVTRIHCIVAKDRDTGLIYHFHDDGTLGGASGSIQQGVEFLMGADELVFHYGYGYDLPVISKLYQKDYGGQLFDSLVLSRTLNPERPHPAGCPYVIPNPVTGRKDRVGPHSIAAWGYRVGRGKPSHYDWTAFSPEMLHRCAEDVEITHLALNAMMREAGCSVGALYEELPGYIRCEQKVAIIMQQQQEAGWLVDRALLSTHITALQNRLLQLEDEIKPQLPMVAESLESRITDPAKAAQYWAKALGTNEVATEGRFRFVVKPFLASGAPSSSVVATFRGKEAASLLVAGMFCRVNFRQVKITSDREIKAFLITQGWVPDEYNRSKKTGQVTSPKFTETSLGTIRGGVGVLIAEHMKARQRLSTMEGWGKALSEDGRLRGVVNPQACPTIRMTHKILVNVPSVEKKSYFAREMRSVFIAKAGYVLVSADADSCQARMLCEYMGDEEFTDVVVNGDKEKGTDIHSYNMRKAGLPTRGHAKNFFYGFIFGAGATKVGKLIGGGMQAGKQIIAQYLKGIPKLKTLREKLATKWKAQGHILSLDGRKIFVQSEKDLLCYLLQGGEAVVMKIAICLMHDWIIREGLDAVQVCVMHDEYTFEVLEKDAERVAFLAEEAIRQAGKLLKLTVPSDGSSAIGENWAEVH